MWHSVDADAMRKVQDFKARSRLFGGRASRIILSRSASLCTANIPFLSSGRVAVHGSSWRRPDASRRRYRSKISSLSPRTRTRGGEGWGGLRSKQLGFSKAVAVLLSYKLKGSKAGGVAETLIREDTIGLATSRFGARRRPTTVVSESLLSAPRAGFASKDPE